MMMFNPTMKHLVYTIHVRSILQIGYPKLRI